MLTEEYRSLNKELHESNPGYGNNGKKWADKIYDLAMSIGTDDILDYGCGKGTLSKNLPFSIKQYDPAIPKYSQTPEPSDIVVCTDVLEHIEPEHLDNVLNDLKRLVKRMGFFVIATRPAKKVLSDGRNAHLIQENERWWLPKLCDRFSIYLYTKKEGEFICVVEAL